MYANLHMVFKAPFHLIRTLELLTVWLWYALASLIPYMYYLDIRSITDLRVCSDGIIA